MVTLLDRTEVVVTVIFSPFILIPCSLSVSSRSLLPSQPDALQPGCIQPWPASVPSAASCPAAAQRHARTRRLPSPASIQPGLCCTSTQDWIVGHSAAFSATLNVLQHFRTW